MASYLKHWPKFSNAAQPCILQASDSFRYVMAAGLPEVSMYFISEVMTLQVRGMGSLSETTLATCSGTP